MTAYLLRYDGFTRVLECGETLSKGRILRLLKPPDDRSIKDGFRANDDDFLEYKVSSSEDAMQEHPTGGLYGIKILQLERFYEPIRPGEQPITFGG